MHNKYDQYEKRGTSRELKVGRKPNLSEKAVLTFLNLWKCLGSVGVGLPLLLFFGTFIKNKDVLPSISDYFYTPLNTIFTGSLILISLFLFANNVNNNHEKIMSRIAAIAAICIIVFPTPVLEKYQIKDDVIYSKEHLESFIRFTSPIPEFVGILHFISAGIFFCTLICLIFFIFIKEETNSPNKLSIRILIYKICGWTMISSILIIIFIKLFGKCLLSSNPNEWTFPCVFTFETLALFAFGISWLVRGHVLQEFLEEYDDHEV